MEVKNYEIAEDRSPVPATQPDAAALDIIRTETVLSRLPVHNLAKKGSISIQIIQKTNTGEVELLWRVSPSRDYGEPRQLAYKLDTIIINQRIDEAGRPLPKLLRLGSLNDICTELGLTLDNGTNAKNIKNAFLQNALTGITAKFNYKANDGTERRLEAGFTRYSVIFTGEKLPDGRKADAVYIVFNEPFWEVLNNAPVRPLDRAYMKELPPAAQRFYEIISRKIFAALKNSYPRAKILYSEYSTFSAQLRHYERQPVQDQMAKVLRPHKKSGYITAMKYEPTIDALNQPDWIMYFTPGPKAYEEFNAAHRTRKSKLNTEGTEAGEGQAKRRPLVMRERRLKYEAPQQPQSVVDLQLVGEFTRRGVTEKKTREILSHLKPGQDAIAQLELGDQHIAKHPGKYTNPAGFYIHLVEENTPLPEGFETTARRKAREEAERRREDERREQVELEAEYQWYRDEEIDRFMAALDPDELATIQKIKWQEMRETYTTLSDTMIDGFARQATRSELAKRAPLMTIEEFKAAREQGTVLSPEPVTESQSTENFTDEPILVGPSQEQAAINEMPTATVSHLPTPGAEQGTPTTRAPESAITQFSESPEPEPRLDSTQPEADLPSVQSTIE